MKRCLPYITKKEVEENHYFIVRKPLDSEKIKNLNFVDTIFDEKCKINGGAIPIPVGYKIFNPATISAVSGKPMYLTKRNSIYHAEKLSKDNVHVAPDDCFLHFPKELSAPYKTDLGIITTTVIQRRYDEILEQYLLHASGNKLGNNDEWIIKYYNLLSTIATETLGKNKLFEKVSITAFNPCSVRAVVVPKTTLNINEVLIPVSVVKKWTMSKNVRNTYQIPYEVDWRKAVKILEGKRVIVGRQPTHRLGNLISFKLKIDWEK